MASRGFLLAFLVLILAGFNSVRAQVDTYDSYTWDNATEGPWDNIPEFGLHITSGTGGAYCFQATHTGILNCVTVELYVLPASDCTCMVSLNADASGKLGGTIGLWPIFNLPSGRFWAEIITPASPDIVLVKGQYYWVQVQAFDSDSDLYWAGSNVPPSQDIEADIDGVYAKKASPCAMDIQVNTPVVPESVEPVSFLGEGSKGAGGATVSSLGSTAQTPFLGAACDSNSTPQPAIIDRLGNVLLSAGSASPSGIDGYVLKSICQCSGATALATLASGPGVTGSTSTALIGGLCIGGSTSYIAARTGLPLTSNTGVSIHSFGSIDGNGSSIFFLATLQGSNITAKNSTALCAAISSGTVNVLLQKGDTIGGKTVSAITTLAGSALTPAAARWRVDDSHIGAAITFTDKSTALYTIPADDSNPADWTRWAGTGDVFTGGTLAGAQIAGFGMPGFGPDGVAVSVLFEKGTGGVTKANDLALIEWSGSTATVLALKGEAAPDTAGSATLPSFVSFGDPICTSSGRAAFPATVAGANSQGLWWIDTDGVVRLIARQGDTAASGGSYTHFTSLDFPPDGAGPLFTAALGVDPTFCVYPGSTEGLWTTNQSTGPRLLLREGTKIYLNSNIEIVSFSALTAAKGCPGTQANFQPGTVDVLVNSTGGQRYLVEIAYGN
jgi:hypothetical protein